MLKRNRILSCNNYLLLIILLLKSSLQIDNEIKIIVLPFKTLNSLNSDFSSPINVTSSIIANPIYTELNITDQKLIAIFNSNEYGFYMTSENCPNNANYFIKKSKFFRNDSFGYASERMILYRDYELKTYQYGLYTRMKLKEYNDKKQCAIFGLQMKSKIYDHEAVQNFIKTFKLNDNIKSCIWTFKYTNDEEGLLIIGASPIVYDPIFKNKKYLSYQTNAVGYTDVVDFGINFDEIRINDKSLGIKHVHFCHDLGVISVNKQVYEDIENLFFRKYIDNKICNKEWIFQKYGYIKCDNKKFTESDINSFPTIYFKKADFGYMFELNSKDLFANKKDGNVYFLIVFDLHFSTTKVGKPFLKKYPFTVDNDNSIISLFLLDTEEGKKDIKGDNNLIYIIILTIIVFILIAVAIFFAYKLYLKKNKNKKRANELDEDYEYLSRENNNYKKAEYKYSEDKYAGNLGI